MILTSYFKPLNSYLYLLTGVFILALNSCAPASLQISEQLLNLELQMTEVQKNRKDMEVKINTLNNKLFLIKERTDINTQDIEKLSSVALLATPPPGLETIKVRPGKKVDRTTPTAKEIPKKSIVKPDLKQKVREELTRRSAEKKKAIEKKRGKPEDVYREAYILFENGKLAHAFNRFSDFIKDFPEHPLADNAQYWIGEIYYSQKAFSRALTEFRKVQDNYPEGNKVPDAVLKMALSYLEIEDNPAYIENLEKLIKLYPASEAALKAGKILKNIQ
ncbi:MAG: tol-pal system protein YbgF [Thermodesulfobacteriota bacterium]